MDVVSLQAAGFLGASALLLAIPAPRRARQSILILLNLAFLALLHPAAPAVFLAVTFIAYAGAIAAAKGGPASLTAALGAAIASLLFLPKLGVFGESAGAAGLSGFAASFARAPAFFAGVSYFSLRAIQFMIDAAREGKVHFNLIEMLAWNGFFPTILAGPIERSQHFAESLSRLGRPGFDDALAGAWRIFIGLLKKVVLSQIAYVWAQPLLDFERGAVPSQLDALLALYAFGFYFYFDFSGYSDLAIGAGRFCGIRLAENFDNPYLRPNISELWRTWHISLTTWIRDYVFLPLCGKSGNRARLAMATIASMVACGLWHGPTLGWALWGCLHGCALLIHQSWTAWLRKRFRWKQRLARSKIAYAAATLINYHFLAAAWTFTAYASSAAELPFRYLSVVLGLPLG